jgi:hypothetical protein
MDNLPHKKITQFSKISINQTINNCGYTDVMPHVENKK